MNPPPSVNPDDHNRDSEKKYFEEFPKNDKPDTKGEKNNNPDTKEGNAFGEEFPKNNKPDTKGGKNDKPDTKK